MGKTGQSGQGNAGGWPATTGNKSGGGRSTNPPGEVSHLVFQRWFRRRQK